MPFRYYLFINTIDFLHWLSICLAWKCCWTLSRYKIASFSKLPLLKLLQLPWEKPQVSLWFFLMTFWPWHGLVNLCLRYLPSVLAGGVGHLENLYIWRIPEKINLSTEQGTVKLISVLIISSLLDSNLGWFLLFVFHQSMGCLRQHWAWTNCCRVIQLMSF